MEVVESCQEGMGCLLEIFRREEPSHLSGRQIILCRVLGRPNRDVWAGKFGDLQVNWDTNLKAYIQRSSIISIKASFSSIAGHLSKEK